MSEESKNARQSSENLNRMTEERKVGEHRTESQRQLTQALDQQDPQQQTAEAIRAASSQNVLKFMLFLRMWFCSLFVFTAFRSLTDRYLYLSFLLAIHCWTVYYILQLVQFINSHRHSPVAENKWLLSLNVSSPLLVILSLCLLSLKKFDFSPINAYTISVPLAIVFVTNFIYCSFARTGCDSLHHLVEIVASFFRLSLIFTILMKTEGRMSDTWSTALWPLWIIITVLCLSCFAIIFSISVISDTLPPEQPQSKIDTGGIWTLCTCAGMTICVIYTTCRVVTLLNDDHDFTQIDYLTIGAPNLVYILIVDISYKFLKDKIDTFFVRIFIEEESEQIATSAPLKDTQNNVEVLTLPKPTFFTRLGLTLFKRSKKKPVTPKADHTVTKENNGCPEVRVIAAASPELVRREGGHRPMPSLTGECAICFEQRANAIMAECGHGGICYDCGMKLLKSQHICPFCRGKVVAVYKVEKTDHASVLEACNAAVYITPGESKEKVCQEIINKAVVPESQ